ncbi:outer membrane protein assembly factor BamB [Undibacterium sp. SXout7W]|uniref:outer membrane protein assembly factor BamB n=1 Tax=Undibacterium sp. SXout7W TaxID=3413049 RepID=UPI003BF2D733
MRAYLKLTSIVAVCVLAGCSSLSSLNPFASKPDAKTAPAALIEFKQTKLMRQKWSIAVGNAGNYLFSPGVDGSDIYAASNDGTVAKINANGQIVWKINAGMRLTAGVGVASNTVVVAGEKGALLAFAEDGRLRWKVQDSTEILSAPVVGQGLVIVRSIDNKITAYDAESGARKWSVERPLPSLTLRTMPGLAIVGQQVVVALPGGRMVALALSNGGIKWEAVVGEPKGSTELERVADVSGSPAIVGRDVCAAAYQGRVGCYDVVTGSSRWFKALSSEVGVSADERFVFAVDASGILNAYLRDGGASAWRNDKLSYRKLSSPTSFDRAVAVGDLAGYVHLLSREDGSFIGRVSTDGSQILAAPIVVGSSLIVQTKSGSVVAFATE